MTANFPTSNHPERSVDAEPLTRARTGPRFLTADQQARMSESELRAESERRRALIEETRAAYHARHGTGRRLAR